MAIIRVAAEEANGVGGKVDYTILVHEGPRLRDCLGKMAAEVDQFKKAGWSDDFPLQIVHAGSTWSTVKELVRYPDLPDLPGAELGA